MRKDLDLSDQLIFNRIVSHLREQGCQSGDEDGCYYRSLDGKKCSVGSVIPNDCYLPTMEGRTVHSLSRDKSVDADLRMFLRLHMPIISDMQCVHDFHFDQSEEYFRYVAAKHYLLLDGEAVNIATQDNPMEPGFKKRRDLLEEGREPRYPDANDGEL